ncbi:MAG: NADH-quinone oxidoreductase subunit J [Phycisphaeraceae bacterium]
MVEVYGLYTATVLGAVALFMMMPRRGYNPRKIGAFLAAATLGGLWLYLGRTLFQRDDLGVASAAMPYYYIFSFIGLTAAVRVITHTQPVYSALWFVMVVLASAGMFLLLGAEFVAFGMVIIYGGAILVTYVFVIMLAAQSEEAAEAGEDDPKSRSTEYERVAREPALAIVAGFLLLATLLNVAFRPMVPNPAARGLTAKEITQGIPAGEGVAGQPRILNADRRAAAGVLEGVDEKTKKRIASVVHADEVENVELVGIELFRGNPLGLELAGVILLVSLIGAVVIARQRGSLD